MPLTYAESQMHENMQGCERMPSSDAFTAAQANVGSVILPFPFERFVRRSLKEVPIWAVNPSKSSSEGP